MGLLKNKYIVGSTMMILCTVMLLLPMYSYAIKVLPKTNVKKNQIKKRYYPKGSPTRAIQNLDDMLGDFIVKSDGRALTAKENRFNRQLKKKIIHGTLDVRELSRLSLGRHWHDRSDEEKDAFVLLLTDLLEEKALFSKEQSAAKSKDGGKYNVKYGGHKFHKTDKTRAFVRTKVIIPSEDITLGLNYKLKKKHREWKIYDIIVDEASLVDNYKYQFGSIISKKGYDDLFGRMSNVLSKIKTKRHGSNEPSQ